MRKKLCKWRLLRLKQENVGTLPVVEADEADQVAGMITDRSFCPS
jgi:hypothetical protein